MKKIVFLSIMFVSCGPPQIDPVSGEKSPYFWKVEKEGKTSYFLGTVHVGVSMDELICRDEIWSKLNQSDLVFVEIPTAETEAADQTMLQYLLSSDGSEFARLDPADQSFLREKGASEHFNWVGLYLFLSKKCTEEVFNQNPALSGSVGMDKDIERVAHSRRIPVHYLDDSAESQISALKSAIDRDSIERGIRSYSDCPGQMKQIMENYKTGQDLPLLQMSPDEIEALLTNRNKQWLNKFIAATDSYDHIFLAAGSAHFFDPSSLLDMVRKEGFSVSRVSCG